MKKILFSLLITFVAFSLNSCSSDDTDNKEIPIEDKIKLTIKVDQKGTLYLFEIPEMYNNFIKYDIPTHTDTNWDGTVYKATQVLVIETGQTETYIKSNSNNVFAYEPKEDPSAYISNNFKSFDKAQLIYIR